MLITSFYVEYNFSMIPSSERNRLYDSLIATRNKIKTEIASGK